MAKQVISQGASDRVFSWPCVHAGLIDNCNFSTPFFYGSQCFYCSAVHQPFEPIVARTDIISYSGFSYQEKIFAKWQKLKQIWMKINFCELREPSSSHLLNVTQNTSDQYNLCWLNGLQGYHIHLQKVFIVPRSIHHPQSLAKCNYLHCHVPENTLEDPESGHLILVHEISTP